MIHIPHVAFLLESPNNYIPLARSKLSIVTCIDHSFIEFYKGLGFDRTIFLPPGVDPEIVKNSNGSKEYDVLMLSTFIDYEAIMASWKTKYKAPLRKAMEEAVESTLADYTTPYYIALVHALDRQVREQSGLDPQTIDFVTILDEIEQVVLGRDRVELIKAIDEAKVDIFGQEEDTAGWKKYLGKKRNVKLHESVPFTQAIELMKHSKIVLDSSPTLKNGANERTFLALAAGACVLTNENIYLRKQFQDKKSILFYEPKRWDLANHRINEYLNDEKKRSALVQKGQKIILGHHTWDDRAEKLVKELPAILDKIREVH
jgi:glycosyltransferase involved in cell wall biosynthesis